MNQKTNTLAQQLWVIEIMGYNFELIFKKGISNQVADALLRLFAGEINAITVFHNDLLKRISHSWLTNSHLVHLIHKAKTKSGSPTKYTWQREQLRKKGKLMVEADSKLRL